MRDGVSAAFVVCSYLSGAAREHVMTRTSRRLGRTFASMLVGATLVGIPLVLLDSSTPANASGTEVIAVISSRNDAAAQLESVFTSHHFNIQVIEEPSSPLRVGSILAVKASAEKAAQRAVLREIPGRCIGGSSGCIDAIALPLGYTGTAQIFVGRQAKPGETYFRAVSIFGPR